MKKFYSLSHFVFFVAIIITSLLFTTIAGAEEAGNIEAANTNNGKYDIFGIKNKNNKWSPYIDLDLKVGNDRNLGRTSLFIPVLQDNDSILFTDYRFMLDNDSNNEYNLGLGYRKINTNKTWIFGGYGFLDRRKSEFDNYFTQGVLGAEALTTHWDFRANLYNILSDDTKGASSANGTYTLKTVNSTIQVSGTEKYETALDGYDFEVGRSVPNLDNLRLFAAYYNFSGTGVKNVIGYRFRANYELNRYVSFEAENQNDGVRGAVNYIGLKLTYPFGSSKDNYDSLSDLEKRMVTPVVRDIDIVTNSESRTITETVTVADGSTQNVIYVDNSNSSSGDGTKSNPYNTLAAAEAAASEYDIIYVYYGDSTSTGMANGITMQDNQKLWGQGLNQTIDYKGSTITVFEGDSSTRPTITNDGSDSSRPYDVVTAANGNEISGLEIGGATYGYGISLYSVNNADIHDNQISNNAFGGISIFDYNAGTYTIANNDIINNSGNGIDIYSSDKVNISNNTISNNTFSGIYIYDYNGPNGTTNTYTIASNTINSNSGKGIEIYSDPDDDDMDVSITNNTITSKSGSGDGGIYAYHSNASGTMDLTIHNNSIDINGLDSSGIELNSVSSTLLTSQITGNTIVNSATTSNGIYAHGRDMSTTVDSNTINGFQYGVHTQTTIGQTTDVTITNNTITGAGSYGIYLSKFSDSTYGIANLGSGVDKDYLLGIGLGASSETGSNTESGNGTNNLYLD